MTIEIPVEEADRLLDELEELARSKATHVEFNRQFLDRLKFLVGSQSAAILSIAPPKRWILIDQSGEIPAKTYDEFREEMEIDHSSDYLIRADETFSWYAYLLRSNGILQGSLLLTFNGRIAPSAIPALRELSAAFGEILLNRQAKQSASILGKAWPLCDALQQRLSDCNSFDELVSVFVNQLLPITAAARVSLASQTDLISNQSSKIVGVSGVSTLDSSSKTIRSLESVAVEALRQAQPVVRQSNSNAKSLEGCDEASPQEDGTFANLIAIRLFREMNETVDDKDIVILEWTTREAMLDATSVIAQWLPILCTTWQQQKRWLHVPKIVRTSSRWRPSALAKRVSNGWPKMVFILGLVLACLWLLLRPYPMMIEAEAVLEPVSRRAIHSSVDGFVDELLVTEGEVVQKGQILARLRSPALDLQIEEAIGQIHAFSEKQNGLRVAENQLTSTGPDAQSTQTRLSADIMLLETQEKLAKAKFEFLMREKSKLAIEAPIDGEVVSRDLQRELASRPVRRGDALFGIVSLDADWQLNIRVADRDTGYLLDHYKDSDKPVTFVFDSMPEEQFQGNIFEIASVIENPSGKKSFLPVFASIDAEVAKKAHVGANARAYFACGSQPTWFVWCRPLVEAIQKRVWLFYDGQAQPIEDSKHAE